MGGDKAGEACIQTLKEGGVAAQYKKIAGEGTGFRVTYDTDDSMFGKFLSTRFVVPRAASRYTVGDLKQKDSEGAIARTTWLYLDSGSLYADSTTAVQLAERVAKDGMRIIFNMSLPETFEDHETDARRLIALSNVVVMNANVAERCDASTNDEENRDWKKGATAIADSPPHQPSTTQSQPEQQPNFVRWVVVTRGEDGYALIEGHPGNKSQTKVSSVPIDPVDWRKWQHERSHDRRGVGDLFAGGLVAALAKGYPIQMAASCGHALAAYSLTQKGPKLPPKTSATYQF